MQETTSPGEGPGAIDADPETLAKTMELLSQMCAGLQVEYQGHGYIVLGQTICGFLAVDGEAEWPAPTVLLPSDLGVSGTSGPMGAIIERDAFLQKQREDARG